ncbi:MAG: polysaccharide biosynthesis protein [Gammaproteobacteria bacterium]|jgi:FlaA1/EpsC-like NDP-sugar epimerase|nr:polysaccharide biosynthesis protein [Gammaproteobacteria bacterium]
MNGEKVQPAVDPGGADADDWIEPVDRRLVAAVTGRTKSLLAEDVAHYERDLRERLRDSQVLVIGASGSIGSAFVKLLVRFRPGGLYLVDINENALADLVRDLRSSWHPVPERFATTVAAFGSPAFSRFLEARGPFDSVFNFSALKHVRTERDPFGLMRMIETNVLAVEDLVRGGLPAGSRLFSVSTDKAVRPTNLMGATKRWMERVVASGEGTVGTTARFANVAFSAGSLPRAFLRRIDLGEPLAGPSDVTRYFISHLEAAQLCLLGGLLGASGEVFVPRLDPARDAVSFPEVARRVLQFHGLEPEWHDDEASAKASPALQSRRGGRWPCVFTSSDTSGEKPLEELLYEQEPVDRQRLLAVDVARQQAPDRQTLASARRIVQEVADTRVWDKSRLIEAIATAVPELQYRDLGRSLDEKM